LAEAKPGALAVVVLPRALADLFPGSPRRIDARGLTLAGIIADADRQVPGLANRVLEAGPAIRRHLNVYVNGIPADLGADVPPGATVHIIPGVSGG
jgi:molybdopterin converting factor small subunit